MDTHITIFYSIIFSVPIPIHTSPIPFHRGSWFREGSSGCQPPFHVWREAAVGGDHHPEVPAQESGTHNCHHLCGREGGRGEGRGGGGRGCSIPCVTALLDHVQSYVRQSSSPPLSHFLPPSLLFFLPPSLPPSLPQEVADLVRKEPNQVSLEWVLRLLQHYIESDPDQTFIIDLIPSLRSALCQEYTENHNSLGHEWPSGLDVNSHPMHRTRFSQYQASSAALG